MLLNLVLDATCRRDPRAELVRCIAFPIVLGSSRTVTTDLALLESDDLPISSGVVLQDVRIRPP